MSFKVFRYYLMGTAAFFGEKGKQYKAELIEGFEKIKNGLAQQTDETKQMLEVYYQYTQGQVGKEEMAKANKQFQDFLKTLGLGVVVILPFSPITIPLIVKLGNKLGVDVLPEAFKGKD